MRKLHSVGRVIEESLKFLRLPSVIKVPVTDSLGLYSAEDVYSSFKLPPRPKTVVDGYAVRSRDVEAAGPSTPVVLRKMEGVIRPSSKEEMVLPEGYAAKIETGALLPEGADAVVPIEDVVEKEDRVYIYKRLAQWENVSLPGEEYDTDIRIVGQGERIQPHSVAGLILEGKETVNVYDLSASILNIGDEIISQTFFRPYTHIFVASWLKTLGVNVNSIDFSPDSVEHIVSWLKKRKEWLTILIGGTSMGGHDLTVQAINKLEPEYMVHGLALQPGKTACVAVKDGRLILAISGLPVAALSTLEVFFRPLARKLGLQVPLLPTIRAKLTRRISVKMGVIGFARVRVYRENEEYYAEPVMLGGSGALASLLRGNGYVIVPEGVEGYDEGETVEVNLYREVENIGEKNI
ncbi:MAG: molybdopterin molybdotransferase MoeA [Thermofilum sp.]|uniref:molybdopterin molybdotransferase MoeA n=1 Tax=Thermofilum sp. TaxID=1961369 RepID=UPI002583ABDC|nr:molybdopterin molybdotransferase MoeA [Thermofilum sp.]MCI4408709.1 molybdopterin molybdotransferase MoeA [Thermofilum sp.]